MSNINRINSQQNLNINNNFNNKVDRANFNQILNNQVNNQKELKISSHAEKRMIERNINLGNEDLMKISNSIDKASLKGANDALILFDDIVMIASVRNKTIITAMDKNQTNEELITNIDSAILIK